jgi:hypothetical protein
MAPASGTAESNEPTAHVNRKVIARLASEIAPGETVYFCQTTLSTRAPASAGLAGFLHPPLNVLITDKRIAAIAKDRHGKTYAETLPFESVGQVLVVQGLLSNSIRVVLDEPMEHTKEYDFAVDVRREWLDEIVSYIERRKGGFAPTLSQRHYQEWESAKTDLLTRMPQMFVSGEVVTVGPRDRDFDSWIASTLGTGERIVATCYSGDEALLVTDDKVLLLKKGAAKAAVSASGLGATVGALSSGWLGLAVGVMADLAVGSSGVIAKSVDFFHITSIDCTRGMMLGHVEVTYPGAREVRTGGFLENAVSENTFQFSNEIFDYIMCVANELRRRVTLAHASPSVTDASPGVIIPDQIRKLAELKDAGILTEEEFQAKKKDLLSRM